MKKGSSRMAGTLPVGLMGIEPTTFCSRPTQKLVNRYPPINIKTEILPFLTHRISLFKPAKIDESGNH